MDIRAIREQLGRVKPYFLRNETLRALTAAVMGLKGVVESNTPPPADVRGLIRDAVQLLGRDELIKKHLQGQLMYQPGSERKILVQLVDLYKKIKHELEYEGFDDAMGRKQKLDQALNMGLKLLEQGQASEADANFAEALTHYKDEHRLFLFIGKALLDAGEVRRALPYLKRGSEANPEDKEIANYLQKALEQRAQA